MTRSSSANLSSEVLTVPPASRDRTRNVSLLVDGVFASGSDIVETPGSPPSPYAHVNRVLTAVATIFSCDHPNEVGRPDHVQNTTDSAAEGEHLT